MEPMDYSILIAEDQDDLRQYTKKILEKEAIIVYEACSGVETLEVLKHRYVDLLLLDLNLGDMDGREIIRILRTQGNELPVIVLSSYGQITQKVSSFDIGCDDYITKPFIKEELLARIRRFQKQRVVKDEYRTVEEKLEAGPFIVDLKSFRIDKEGKEIVLNRKLFEIFVFFLRHSGQIISKEQLLDRFWWDQEVPSENTLNVHIHMLREKIEENSRKPVFLKTKRGIGYFFEV